MTTLELFDRLAKRIDGYRDYVIEMETALTAIPALAPPKGEGECKKAEFLKKHLTEVLGVEDITEYDAPDPEVPCGHRPNLIARIPGVNRNKTVWLMAHMDVVDPGNLDDWDSDPWKVRVEGDKLYGRGVEDNQQGLVASLCLVKALKEEGVTPPCDLALLLVADEETGNDKGIGYVVDNHEVFGKDDLIIVPDGGLPDGSQVEVAEKGIAWFEFHVQGKQCHASTPDAGLNAHRVAAHLVVALEALQDRFDAEDPVFDPPRSTFEPTLHKENVKSTNVIPGDEVFHMDCRVLPSYSLDAVKEAVDGICKEVAARFSRSDQTCTISWKVIQEMTAAPATPVDAPVVEALTAAVKDVYGVDARAEGIGGGTVAAHIRKKGYSAVVWARMDETMHSPNEYALIPNILGDAKVFAHVVASTK